MKKDFLDDVPLPKGNDLLYATAALTMAGGSAILVKPQKMHDLYFEEKDEDEAPLPMHKPTTRWLGMSLLWVGGMNLAAGLAPHGPAKKKLLVANGAGLLAGASRLRDFLRRGVRGEGRDHSRAETIEHSDGKTNNASILEPAGAAMDTYNLCKKTQKKKTSAGEIAAIGTLGALSLARAVKGCDDDDDC
jgi:hypothetical protein